MTSSRKMMGSMSNTIIHGSKQHDNSNNNDTNMAEFAIRATP